MKLTVQTDYTLRVLMHLAVNSEGLVTISQIADHFDISKNHLMKVAHQLSKRGVIEAVRGRSGGLRLAKSPKDINLGNIVQFIEQDSVLVECFPGGKNGCIISNACRLKGILFEAQTAFFECLNKYSIADLVLDNAPLKQLLLESEAV